MSKNELGVCHIHAPSFNTHNFFAHAPTPL
jgi:hypothetical protein